MKENHRTNDTWVASNVLKQKRVVIERNLKEREEYPRDIIAALMLQGTIEEGMNEKGSSQPYRYTSTEIVPRFKISVCSDIAELQIIELLN